MRIRLVEPAVTAVGAAICFLLMTGFSWEHPSTSGSVTEGPETKPMRSVETPKSKKTEKRAARVKERDEEETAVTDREEPPAVEEEKSSESETAEEAVPEENTDKEEVTEDVPAQEETAETSPEEPSASPEKDTSGTLSRAKLTLFVNDAKNQRMYKGWPIFVKVTVENPSGPGEDLSYGDSEKPWHKELEIEVLDSKGRVNAWPFHLAPVTKVEDTLELEPGHAATLVYLISGKEMQAVRAGSYRLKASLADASSGPAVQIDIAEHPEELSEEEENYRDKLTALYDFMTGKKQQAAAIPAAQPQPQVVYVVQQQAPPRDDGSAAEAISSIAGLVSEFGYGNAVSLDDYSGSTDYSD